MRPGNRARAAVALTGRPGNRPLAATPPTLQTVAVQASVAAAQVEQASGASIALDTSDIGTTVQSEAAALTALSQGALKVAARGVSASGGVLVTDYLINADATTAAIVITLPAAGASTFRQLVIKKVDGSVHTVTVDGNGAETIDGAATYVLAAQYDTVSIQCDGVGWYIV